MPGTRILVVDDNDMVRSVAQQMLVALGYEAAVVDSGERALEEFSVSSFDLILLDLYLPWLFPVAFRRAAGPRRRFPG